jgi:DMSO/TMAO reductase YedYZ molybdopterin-dependent catalytic subunit
MKTLRAVLFPAVLLAMLTSVSPGCAQMAGMEHGKGTPSTSLTVTVGVTTKTFSVADLQAMPQKTVNVHNAHVNKDETYTGVVLTDVLKAAGAPDAAMGKALLRSYVKAQGTDNYWVLYSGIEIDRASHVGDVIVAVAVGGAPLGENGGFMMVSTEDTKPQRWVRNLTAVTLTKVE